MSFGVENDDYSGRAASRSEYAPQLHHPMYYSPMDNQLSASQHHQGFSSSANAGFSDLPRDMKFEMLRNATDAALYRMCNEQWDVHSYCSTDPTLRARFERINANLARLLEKQSYPLSHLMASAKTEDERRNILNHIIDYQAMGNGDDVLDINRAVGLMTYEQKKFDYELFISPLFLHVPPKRNVEPTKIPTVLALFNIRRLTVFAVNYDDGGKTITSEYLDKILAPKMNAGSLKTVILDYDMNGVWPLQFLAKFGATITTLTIIDKSKTIRKVPKQLFEMCPSIEILTLEMPLDRLSKSVARLTHLFSLHIDAEGILATSTDAGKPHGKISKLPVGLNRLDLNELILQHIYSPFTFDRATFPSRRLVHLRLGFVKLEGNALPDWLGEITTIEHIYLDHVTLNMIPKSVLALPRLRELTTGDDDNKLLLRSLGSQDEMEKFRMRLRQY